jgi:hypothetical protein
MQLGYVTASHGARTGKHEQFLGQHLQVVATQIERGQRAKVHSFILWRRKTSQTLINK